MLCLYLIFLVSTGACARAFQQWHADLKELPLLLPTLALFFNRLGWRRAFLFSLLFCGWVSGLFHGPWFPSSGPRSTPRDPDHQRQAGRCSFSWRALCRFSECVRGNAWVPRALRRFCASYGVFGWNPFPFLRVLKPVVWASPGVCDGVEGPGVKPGVFKEASRNSVSRKTHLFVTVSSS